MDQNYLSTSKKNLKRRMRSAMKFLTTGEGQSRELCKGTRPPSAWRCANPPIRGTNVTRKTPQKPRKEARCGIESKELLMDQWKDEIRAPRRRHWQQNAGRRSLGLYGWAGEQRPRFFDLEGGSGHRIASRLPLGGRRRRQRRSSSASPWKWRKLCSDPGSSGKNELLLGRGSDFFSPQILH